MGKALLIKYVIIQTATPTEDLIIRAPIRGRGFLVFFVFIKSSLVSWKVQHYAAVKVGLFFLCFCSFLTVQDNEKLIIK